MYFLKAQFEKKSVTTKKNNKVYVDSIVLDTFPKEKFDMSR